MIDPKLSNLKERAALARGALHEAAAAGHPVEALRRAALAADAAVHAYQRDANAPAASPMPLPPNVAEAVAPINEIARAIETIVASVNEGDWAPARLASVRVERAADACGIPELDAAVAALREALIREDENATAEALDAIANACSAAPATPGITSTAKASRSARVEAPRPTPPPGHAFGGPTRIR
jgi:hypothetical protein